MFSFDKSKFKGICVPYARFSTKGQSKIGKKSLERQIEEARRYAKSNNLYINEDLIFADKGISGFAQQGNIAKAFKKGQMQVMLALLEEVPYQEREFIYVTFHNFDRFSRMSPKQARTYFDLILQKGFNVVTTIDNQLYTRHDKDLGKMLISTIKMTTAWEESQVKSIYIKDALARKKKVVEYLYHHPSQKGKYKHIGVVQPNMPRWIDHEKIELTYTDESGSKRTDSFKKFTLNKEKTKIVNYIFDLKIQGLGYARICRRLNEEGIPTFDQGKHRIAKKWHIFAVQNLICNEMVLGHITLHTHNEEEYMCEIDKVFKKRKIKQTATEKLYNYYPAAVSEAKYLEAHKNTIQQDKPKKLGRIGERTNIFAQILLCECGGTLQYRRTKKNKKNSESVSVNEYLQCNNAFVNHKCNSQTINYTLLETAFFRYVNNIDFKKICSTTNSKHALKIIDLDTDIKELADEIESLKLREAGLAKTYMSLASAGLDGSTALIDREKTKKEIAEKVLELENLELKKKGLEIEADKDNREFVDINDYMMNKDNYSSDEKIIIRKKINDFLHSKIEWMEVVSTERQKFVIIAFHDTVIRTFAFDDRCANDLMFNEIDVDLSGLNRVQASNLMFTLIKAIRNSLKGVEAVITKADLISYLQHIKQDYLKNIGEQASV
ncbi:recombinase family protein [Vibrio parahaemolyticus]|nr:recombinase family protein [Vibrio parahaemolyticus]